MPQRGIADRLRSYVERAPGSADYSLEADAEAQFAALEREEAARQRQRQAALHPSYAAIPKFYTKSNENPLHLKWRQEARKSLLQKKSDQMWDTNIMHMLWQLLLDHCYVDLGGEKENGLMDFAIYDTVRHQLIHDWNSKAKDEDDTHPIDLEPFLTARAFLRLPKDDMGRLPILTFFNYMLKKVTLFQTRVELGVNNLLGDGFLLESEMENYFYDLIPTLPALSRLPEHFYPFYVCGAVRKFFFFLDPQRRGRIPIDAVMQSSALAELMELQNASEEEECTGNWFAATSAAKVYTHYTQLDTDRNGMLSMEEMYGYNDGSFTRLFMQRVFEVSQTYAGEMDYKKYIEFVLTMENAGSKQSFDFFWKVLDLQNVGYLTPFVIKMFYREVQAKLVENGFDAVKMEDFVVEVFDMINPETPLTVYRKDLERCRNRDTIVSILIDYKAFWRYDNREQLATHQAAQQQPPPQQPAAQKGNVYDYRSLANEIDDALA